MKSKLSEEQISGFLEQVEADAGMPVAEICRKCSFKPPAAPGTVGMSAHDGRCSSPSPEEASSEHAAS